MKERIPVHTVAFEGLHRSGKGTQIEILEGRLTDLRIPFVSIRGAGSRLNEGSKPGDKYSEWWDAHLKTLRSPTATKEDWVEGSRRLAREVLIFRDRFLPDLAEEKGADRAVLLIDRTFLSHMAMLGTEDLDKLDAESVYGEKDRNNRKVPDLRKIFPDLLFYLKAAPLYLHTRLDPKDPKYEFRKKNIDENSYSFDIAIEKMPTDLRERIIEVNAERSIEEVAKDISEAISRKITLPLT